MQARFIAPLVGTGAFAAAAAGQHGPAPTWMVEFGSAETDWASGLAPDGSGGVFVAGDTGGDLGGPSAGYVDAYVARYNSEGERLWLTQFGTEMTEWDALVAPDGAGGVFATGRTFGSFVGTPRVDDTDVWLARLDAAGEMLWVHEFGDNGQDAGWGLAPDGADGVFVAGQAESSLGGSGAGLGAFVARHDGEGRQLWVNQFGASRGDSANAIDGDGADGLFVAGHTYGELGGKSAGESDAFLARMDSDGQFLWIRQFGTDGRDEAHGIASDGAGEVFVAGQTGGDVFVAQYDGDGNQMWIIQFGTPRPDRVGGIVSDGAGGVLITGETDGDLGGAFAGFRDAFVARCDGAGNVLWVTQFGAPGVRTTGQGIGLDGAGGVFVAGGAFPLFPDDGEAWLARFPLDAGCYADCDGSGELDLFDLLCFQNLFTAAAPRADCNLSGNLDFFDFLCFQDEFAAGCP